MPLMVVLGVALVAGLVAAIRWGNLELQTPWERDGSHSPLGAKELLRRYIWFLSVLSAAGVGSGLLIIGAGGRLAMRLLAVTAGDTAQGRITEAGEIVGEITLDGTIGFILFNGLLGGLLTGALYLVIYRWLPGGYWRGITYGAFLLILLGTRIEPLRADNPDFDIVGPGWLSVAVYVSMGIAHGMLVAGIAGRYSRALPLLSKNFKAVVAHAPLIVFGLAFPLLLPIAITAVVVVLLGYVGPLRSLLRSPRFEPAGRILGAILIAAALPGFVSSLVDIVGRA